MDSERIEQLLKETDQRSTGRPSDPAELANRVVSTLRRRRATRTVATLLIVGGLFGVTLTNLPQPSPTPEIAILTKPSPEPRVEDELASIQAEITMRETTVRRLEAIERRARVNVHLAAQPLEPREDQIVERAATAVVYQADRMLQSPGLRDSAAKAYTEVINHFPLTSSAASARARLAQIEREG